MSSDSFVDLTALLLGFEERLARQLGSELHQIRSEIRQQGSSSRTIWPMSPPRWMGQSLLTIWPRWVGQAPRIQAVRLLRNEKLALQALRIVLGHVLKATHAKHAWWQQRDWFTGRLGMLVLVMLVTRR